MQGQTEVMFFSFFYKPFNGAITDDCTHFAYQLLLTSKPYHFKLNLANGPDKRLSQSKNPAVRNCSSQQLHINAVITSASADVNFLFIWLHLVCLSYRALRRFALRKCQQTMRVIGYKRAHITILTFYCHCKCARVSVLPSEVLMRTL